MVQAESQAQASEQTGHTKTSIGRVLKPFLPFPDTRTVTQSVFTLLLWLERAIQESLRGH